ncbi:hypothetical protein [Streptomyces flaveolus]|uniref:hypothetical protein n=1 Tax=Streptomyces flaveolus TaxID=67297 RepID=UPI0036FBE266
MLGTLLDRAHLLPPDRIGPIVAEAVSRIGGREVSLLLQDHGQWVLVPFPGPGLAAKDPPADRRVRCRYGLPRSACSRGPPGRWRAALHPAVGSGDQVGVLAVTLARIDDDRRLLRRIACVVADMLVTGRPWAAAPQLVLPGWTPGGGSCSGLHVVAHVQAEA